MWGEKWLKWCADGRIEGCRALHITLITLMEVAQVQFMINHMAQCILKRLNWLAQRGVSR